MNNTILILILSAISFLSVSCVDPGDLVHNEPAPYCEFIQDDEAEDGVIDETESMIMESCIENAFSTKEEIEENLIGEWLLIGHGQGWFTKGTQPCSYIIIEKNELTFHFEDENIDLTVTSEWEVEVNEAPSGTFFKLEIDSEEKHEAINNTIFSPDYMFSNYLFVDGNMYLYEKID